MSTTVQGQPVGNHGLGDPATHKRPWEEVPGEPERPGHISRTQMHFDKHIMDRNEPRANHPGWVDPPPKKRRTTKSHHQAARDHQSMSDARSHHEYHNSRPISYGAPMYDPSKSGQSIHTPEGRTYRPVGWRQQDGDSDKYAKNQEPLTLDVDETLPPPAGWTERPRDYNLLPIGKGGSSRGDGNSQSSLSPQPPQRLPYHPSQPPQAYLSQINERPPPPQQQQPPSRYQQPPPRQESTGPPPPPSNYQPPQQPASYQQPSQRPIESGEAVRHQQDWSEYRREGPRERPSPSMPANVRWGGHPPPPSSQSSYDQRSVERAQEPARYQSQQQQQQQLGHHEYHQQPPPQQQQQQQPEYSSAPRPASRTRFRDQSHEQQAQQPEQAPPPARQYDAQPLPTQSHARIAFTAAGCKSCVDSGKILRAFEEQAKKIYSLFGLWGGYTEIHEEYTGKGYGHDDIPGFKEFHRITALVGEASALAGYMIKLAPLLTKSIKHEKDGDVDRVPAVDSEVFRLRKELGEKVRELRIDGREESATPSSYASEPRPQIAYFIGEQRLASMAPPSVPQQQPSPVPSQSSQAPTMLTRHPQSPAPLGSSHIEPASTRRSATFNASRTSQSANVPTFVVEDSASTSLSAKLDKLKARLETEIAEVDNLTEEKKRLEERIKELEAMVEEERERRREQVDTGMKDRASFLSVLEGVVALGRREGDPVIKRESGMLSSFGNSGSRDDGGDEPDEVVETGDLATLTKEVEKLRERNRVCENALEHIARETRHMEETGRKVEESRRGIDLVLGRVLAGREPGSGVLAIAASPVPDPVVVVNGASLAIEAAPAPPEVVLAAPAVPLIPKALTPVVEREVNKEVIEGRE